LVPDACALANIGFWGNISGWMDTDSHGSILYLSVMVIQVESRTEDSVPSPA
jgi:hypothetical protein